MIKENVKGCGIKTKVRGIRADEDFWDNCQIVADSQKTDVNKIIVFAVSKFCEKKLKQIAKKQNKQKNT